MKLFKHIDFDLLSRTIALVALVGCSGEKIIPLSQGEIIPPPLMITFKINDYCPSSFVDFFVKPMSFEIQKGALQQDTNRDGLADNEALFFGLSPFDQPTSGITDFLGIEYLGLTPSQLPSIPQCPNSTQATAGDILTDCQKDALGLVPLSNFDSAHRGFPDSLAAFARLPLFDSNVATEDLAGDGIETIQKIKWNLPPDETVNPQDMIFAVNYTTTTYPSTSNPGVTCYDFTVTSPRSGVQNGDLYNFYFISTSISVWATGTVAANSISMSSLSSASGIVPGMSVSGTDVPAGTTVVAVSGTGVTLSQKATGSSTGTYLFMGANGSGQNTLVTKAIVVPATEANGATEEFEYDAL